MREVAVYCAAAFAAMMVSSGAWLAYNFAGAPMGFGRLASSGITMAASGIFAAAAIAVRALREKEGKKNKTEEDNV